MPHCRCSVVDVTATEPVAALGCPPSQVISKIVFADFGEADHHYCGAFHLPRSGCYIHNSREIVEDACLGRSSCEINVTVNDQNVRGVAYKATFKRPCPHRYISQSLELVVEIRCSDLDDAEL